MERPNLKEQLSEYIRLYEFPTDILIETTSVCNLKCIMCPQPKLTRPSGTMTFELWKKLIDEIAEKSPDTKIWPALMGEPLVDKIIFKRLKYAKDRGLTQVNMNSNLMLFKDHMIDPFFDCGFDAMYVGMDGATPDTYAKIRVNGKLEKVQERLFFIVNEKAKRNLSKPDITVQFICMDENEHEEQAFLDHWQSLGLDINIKVRPRLDWASGVEAWSKLKDFNPTERVPCTWLLRQMAVYWDGQVPQCDADWNGATDFGNANNSSIEVIWKDKIKVLQEKHLSYQFDASPLCPSCDEWKAGLSQYIQVGTSTEEPSTVGPTN